MRGVLTSIICVDQRDIKWLISYSSIGHMGVILAGMIREFIVGWEGGILIMICHGLCSPGLFCIG